MTALWIILSVLFVLLFLLFLPIRITLTYNGDVSARLSVLGIGPSLYPKRKRTASRKKRRGRKPKISKGHKAPQKKKKTVADHIRTAKFFLTVLGRMQKKLRASFRIRIVRMHASIATGDAASTALLYGVVSQSFAYALSLAGHFLKTSYRAKDICVFADYLGSDSRFDVKIIMSSNLFLLGTAGIKTLYVMYTSKTNEKNQVTEEHISG